MNSLRIFSVQGNRIVHYSEDLEKYTRTYELGDVVWPVYSILFAKNLGDLVDEMRRRNLYLFDVCGYRARHGSRRRLEQFKTPAEALKLLEAKLGPRWLGMDVGEQDGRYIGLYAAQMYPASASRLEQYFNFQRHFQRMTDDLGNKMAALLSLNFGHYFLKEGVYTLWRRDGPGAAEQSGLLCLHPRRRQAIRRALVRQCVDLQSLGFQDVWRKGVDRFNYRYGPTQGTSLSLLKRLMYSGILYNWAIVGFESLLV